MTPKGLAGGLGVVWVDEGGVWGRVLGSAFEKQGWGWEGEKSFPPSPVRCEHRLREGAVGLVVRREEGGEGRGGGLDLSLIHI